MHAAHERLLEVEESHREKVEKLGATNAKELRQARQEASDKEAALRAATDAAERSQAEAKGKAQAEAALAAQLATARRALSDEKAATARVQAALEGAAWLEFAPLQPIKHVTWRARASQRRRSATDTRARHTARPRRSRSAPFGRCTHAHACTQPTRRCRPTSIHDCHSTGARG